MVAIKTEEVIMKMDKAQKKMFNALSVIVLDKRIRAWLEANDPNALAQAEEARECYSLALAHGDVRAITDGAEERFKSFVDAAAEMKERVDGIRTWRFTAVSEGKIEHKDAQQVWANGVEVKLALDAMSSHIVNAFGWKLDDNKN